MKSFVHSLFSLMEAQTLISETTERPRRLLRRGGVGQNKETGSAARMAAAAPRAAQPYIEWGSGFCGDSGGLKVSAVWSIPNRSNHRESHRNTCWRISRCFIINALIMPSVLTHSQTAITASIATTQQRLSDDAPETFPIIKSPWWKLPVIKGRF